MEFKILSPQDGNLVQDISWNNEELKAEISAKMKDYKGLVFTEETIKEAKKDRASLNKLRSAFEDERKRIKKLYMDAVYGDDGKLDVEATMKKINEEASKHIIPKEQYNGKVKELEAANKTIGELKKGNADNETLQKTIKDHEATIKQLKADHDKEIKGMRIDAAISKVLADNNAKHADLLSGKFDREKLIVAEDGTVSGLDEQMKGLKESYKDLFGATVSGRTPANPEGRNNVPTFESLVDNADTMTAEEVAAQFAALETK